MLATKHGKLVCIGPALAAVGLAVQVAEVDTDVLGTFTGEVPRAASPRATAVAKARLGMDATGGALGLASEGSFGPHPSAPWVIVDTEIVVLVDDRRGIEVAGVASSTEVVAVARAVDVRGDLAPVVADADLPTHAVTVVPNDGSTGPIHKGLRRLPDVATAVADCAAASTDGRARVETDLRAHVCPGRREVIRAAAGDLASRPGSRCRLCRSPGWGRVDVVVGVPCGWCGTDVDHVRAEVDACPACAHRAERAVLPAGAVADPGSCPRGNP